MIRRPVVSGRFYPADKKELYRELEGFFKDASNSIDKNICDKSIFFGGVSPHAGYIFSGRVAAGLFSCINVSILKDPVFVILGPDHTGLSRPVAISDADLWETPIGNIQVSSKLKEQSKALKWFELDNTSHLQEHSIEVQLPFIQYIMKEKHFEILPISVSLHDKNALNEASKSLRALYDLNDDRDLIFIISSDFSHYVSSAQAKTLDMPAIELMKDMRAEDLFDYVYKNNISICGISPILLFINAFSDIVKGELLEYTDSSKAQPMEKVVAYASITYLQRG